MTKTNLMMVTMMKWREEKKGLERRKDRGRERRMEGKKEEKGR